jgi:hypothetical protein
MTPEGEPETDAEIVEVCRKKMQEMIDRVDWDAGSVKAGLDSVGIPHHPFEVSLAELREVGSFEVVLPPAQLASKPVWMRATLARHWVFQRKADKQVFVLHLPARLRLRETGHTRIYAFDERTKKD